MGVVLACPPCFLGFGVLLVSRFFLLPCGLVVGGGGSGCWGFSRVRGWCARFLCSARGLGAPGAPGSCVFVRGLGACAPGSCFPVFWGVGVGCVCASGSFLGCGFRGWVGRPGSFWGLGVPGFLFVFAVVFVVFAKGFPGVLFPLGASFLWFGGCRVGLGLFFLRLFCSVRVRVGSLLGVGPGSGSGVGFVWRV